MKKTIYETPKIEIIAIEFEGAILTESVGEGDGNGVSLGGQSNVDGTGNF